MRLLGTLALERSGQPVELPTSKKTRALLAYLATRDRPARRERLCTIFWETPDDPRGALRWSLSKLRAALGGGEDSPLIADRETVMLDSNAVPTDWHRLRFIAHSGDLRDTPLDDLVEAARLGSEFLAGLDLPRCEEYQAWLTAMREEVRRWRLDVLREIASRNLDPERALPFARDWSALDPFDAIARLKLVELLDATGRRDEAQQQREAGARKLDEADIPVPRELRGSGPATHSRHDEPLPAQAQHTRFCVTPDGTGLAYSIAGEGPPLVKTANWLNHLEYDWDSPLWRHWISELTSYCTLVRYDERGNGLSDWDTPTISFDAFVDDLETVVDAAGLDQFDLLGMSQGCAVSIAYAVRHPKRVRRMVLYGGYSRGWANRGDDASQAAREAMVTLIRTGWGQDNPAFRQMFTTLFMPDADPDETKWFNELQRVSTSPANAVLLQRAFSEIDVVDLVSQVSVPTLVMHGRDDAVVPFSQGRALAAAIPNAEFVALDSVNHMVLDHEPAWARTKEAIRDFLTRGRN